MINSNLLLLTTNFFWSTLSFGKETLEQALPIKNWLEQPPAAKPGVEENEKVKPGFRALFTGPVGAGKSTMAAAIGKEFLQPVYKSDLSKVVSKYIGETEKNLEKIFTDAQGTSWILLFDEAGSLFGKRTGVGDAHDRYSVISSLLQKMNRYHGLSILSTSFKDKIDDAFTKNFEAVVSFPPL